MQGRPNAPGLCLGAFAFLLTVLFVPWISGAATTPRWALLSLATPLFLIFVPGRTTWTFAHLFGAVFLGWAAVTLTWTSGGYEGADVLWKLCLFAALFVCGSRLSSLQPILIGAGLGFAVNSAIVLLQWAELVQMPEVQCCAALFVNPNYLAEPAALALVGAAAYRLWWLVPGLIPAVLAGGRGPLIALAACGAAWMWSRSRIGALLIAALALTACLMIATGGGHNDSAAQRVALWTDTLLGMQPLGRGLGSFYVMFPSHAPHNQPIQMRPDHAHNDLLELAYETGPGVVAALAFLAFALAGPARPERLILLGFVVEGFFDWPLHFPVPLFLAALAAGRLCRDRVPLRDDLSQRGISLYRRAAMVLESGGRRRAA